MLARFERAACELVVRGDGRGDDDRRECGVGEELCVVGVARARRERRATRERRASVSQTQRNCAASFSAKLRMRFGPQ